MKFRGVSNHKDGGFVANIGHKLQLHGEFASPNSDQPGVLVTVMEARP